jgi:hypothetical protein
MGVHFLVNCSVVPVCLCLIILIHFDESSDGFEDMLDLVDVLDSSGNENNNIPSLQSITDSLDDEDNFMWIIGLPEHLGTHQATWNVIA